MVVIGWVVVGFACARGAFVVCVFVCFRWAGVARSNCLRLSVAFLLLVGWWGSTDGMAPFACVTCAVENGELVFGVCDGVVLDCSRGKVAGRSFGRCCGGVRVLSCEEGGIRRVLG